MAIRIQHPEHGYHNVFSQIEYETHVKSGWVKCEGKKPEPIKSVIVEPEKPVEVVVEPIVKEESKKEMFKCDTCDKVFKMEMHLMNHKRKCKR